MTQTTCHYKGVENFVNTEPFSFQSLGLQCIQNSAYSVENAAEKQPEKSPG